MKKISVIILNYNTSAMTHKTVEALLASNGTFSLEVIVVDNASQETLEPFSDPRITTIRNEENLGFARGVNKGLEYATGEYILLLNSDVLMEKQALAQLSEFLDTHEHCGIVAPLFRYPNGKFQPSSGKFPSLWREFLRFSTLWKFVPGSTLNSRVSKNATKPQELDWVSGGCFLTRKILFDQIGPLDANFFFGVEDFDFCLRAKKAGWQVVYYPLACVVHHHGFSSGGRRSTTSLAREASGMDYFMKKNFPNKSFLRVWIKGLYRSKIAILNAVSTKLRNNESFTRK